MATAPANLQTASFRGLPFGVEIEDGTYGRRQAVHEYPYRPKPSLEDMGRATRVHNVTGFLLTNNLYGGSGDAVAQRDAMVGAAETEGSGELVHPTLGSMTVSLLRLQVIGRVQDGGGHYFELRFFLYEPGDRLYPTLDAATGDVTNSAAGAAQTAAAADFATRAQSSLQQGAAVVQQAVSTTRQWVAKAQNLAQDATGIAGIASRLQGTFGRYVGGRNVSGITGAFSGISSINAQFTTVDTAIASATGARTSVISAGTTLGNLASGLNLT